MRPGSTSKRKRLSKIWSTSGMTNDHRRRHRFQKRRRRWALFTSPQSSRAEGDPSRQCRAAAQPQVRLSTRTLYPGGHRPTGQPEPLSIVNPLRLEIETQFLRPTTFDRNTPASPVSSTTAGLPSTATPPSGGINDTPDSIHELALRYRTAGIEFHTFIVAGLPLQDHGTSGTRWTFTTWWTSPPGCAAKAAAAKSPAISSTRLG